MSNKELARTLRTAAVTVRKNIVLHRLLLIAAERLEAIPDGL